MSEMSVCSVHQKEEKKKKPTPKPTQLKWKITHIHIHRSCLWKKYGVPFREKKRERKKGKSKRCKGERVLAVLKTVWSDLHFLWSSSVVIITSVRFAWKCRACFFYYFHSVCLCAYVCVWFLSLLSVGEYSVWVLFCNDKPHFSWGHVVMVWLLIVALLQETGQCFSAAVCFSHGCYADFCSKAFSPFFCKD